MHKELIIYCDESSSKERHFSDFYGGALVGSSHIDEVRSVLSAKKKQLNLLGEIKWTKITENYAQKYIQMMDCFFDLIRDGKVKIRIMFTQNMYSAKGLRKDQIDNKYFMLYYQFIKHAFGLQYATNSDNPVDIRIYLDKMPDTDIKVDQFKEYLIVMTKAAEYRNTGIHVKKENITEVSSHEHDILQCLDVVLGSINFRLNDKHKDKPEGKKRRARRTVAKETVYKHINKRIAAIYPFFNIGVSTGLAGNYENRWLHPYRHWLFMPSSYSVTGTSKRKR